MILRRIDVILNFSSKSFSTLINNYNGFKYSIIYNVCGKYDGILPSFSHRRFTSSIGVSRDSNLGRRSSFRNLINSSNNFEGSESDLGREEILRTGSTGEQSSESGLVRVRRDVVCENGNLRGVHFTKHYEDSYKFVPYPFNRRFGFSKRPLFPIEPRNLRIYGLLRHKKKGVGEKSSSRGIRHKHKKRRGSKPNSRTFEGGQTPLYKRLPKYPEAILSKFDKKYDVLNLCKLRYFIERGRIDTRFPITQRHLHDSKCVKVKNGVHLFNVNNYPFPYKIDITVASCDQSSVDVIKAVGGSVTIIHYDRVSLRAHVKPYKFEILPKTSRPDIKRVYELEKFRMMGCNVVYIKPLWLIKEEERLVQEFKELYRNCSNEDFDEIVTKYRTKILEDQISKEPQ